MDSVASPTCARPQPSAAARPAETKQGSEVIRGSRPARAMLLADFAYECSPQYPRGPTPLAESSEASLLKAAESGLDFGIGCELATLGLSKTFQHGGKVRGIDFLLSLIHIS